MTTWVRCAWTWMDDSTQYEVWGDDGLWKSQAALERFIRNSTRTHARMFYRGFTIAAFIPETERGE